MFYLLSNIRKKNLNFKTIFGLFIHYDSTKIEYKY